jgi:hypothetical protein
MEAIGVFGERGMPAQMPRSNAVQHPRVAVSSPTRLPVMRATISATRRQCAAPPIGGLFMRTKPDRSRCSTRRLATIADMISSALWTRLPPLTRSANARSSPTF